MSRVRHKRGDVLAGLVLLALLAPMGCEGEQSDTERYCDAVCAWMAQCQNEGQTPVDVDTCKSECNDAFDKSQLGEVCQDEHLDYLVCGYEKSRDKGCIGDPATSLTEGHAIPGCEDRYAALEECLAPGDAGSPGDAG
jgi:hypothetical protein